MKHISGSIWPSKYCCTIPWLVLFGNMNMLCGEEHLCLLGCFIVLPVSEL